MPLHVFISHSHTDAEIAKAVRVLLDRTFETQVTVHASSDSVAHGGIAAGAEWLEWIKDQVRTCRVALVLFTRDSLNRPWLMWESGAVLGVAEAIEEKRTIVPVVLRMPPAKVPTPLQHLNIVAGDDPANVDRLLDTIEELVEMRHPGQRERRLVQVPQFLETVARALDERPQPLTEDLVVEWSERIDDFRRTGRYADLGHLHRALLLAVASGPKPEEAVLDVRLHRRLGELYLDRGHGREAADQFKLALRKVPRDIFLSHRLGMAQCEYGAHEDAAQTLAGILRLDAEAALVNPEIAGLKGRIFRQRWQIGRDPDDLRQARDAYRDAIAHNPKSLYLTVNVGELSLALGEEETGLAAYDRAVELVRQQGDRDLWSVSTRAQAAVAHRDWAAAHEHLRLVDELTHVRRERESVRQALRRLVTLVGPASTEVAAWIDRPSAG